jgi:MFS family permease
MPETSKETIWSFPYITLMVVNFFQSMAAFMANTTIPVFANSLGASTAFVGVVVSSFAITALLIRPFAGPAFDSFSRKRLLLITQAIICASFVLYATIDSLPMLMAVRLLHGIGIGCGGPLAMSLVSEFLPKSKFASGISIYTLAQSFAQVIGPAVGLYLVESIGFSVTYFLAAGFLLIAMCCIFFVKEPQRERLPYEFKPSRMFAREAIDKAFVLMLLATSFSCVVSYIVLYTYELGIEGVGLYFTVYACCLLVTRPVFGKLADKWGPPRVLVIGALCFAASYVMLSIVNDMPGLLVTAVVGSAGFGACAPLVQTLALSSVPPERRGAASNTSFTGLDVGMLLGPVIGGHVAEALIDVTGSLAGAYSLMWLVMLIPLACAFAIIVRWNLKMQRQNRSNE